MKQEIALALGHTHAKMQVTSLPFVAVPGQSRLFLTYLDDPSSVTRFYPNLFQLKADPKAWAARVVERYETDRGELCDALFEINTAVGASSSSLVNIERLRKAGSVVVVTGQQAGLFTGPLYTIYKAISAIRFARSLSEKGIDAVPVFWVATEDHDMDEVSSANLIGRDDEFLRVSYRPQAFVPETPVGSAVIDAGIAEVIDQLFDGLPRTEFSGDAREIVEDAYRAGVGYGSAFGTMMSRLFSGHGLVLVDPMDHAIKRLAAPLYSRAIEMSDDLVTAIRARTAELEVRGFHSQVLVDEDHFPLFWHDEDGRRLSLRSVGNDSFRAKQIGREFSRAELAALASREPSRLSPNVMLRPVVQDHLLPTICYFGGAAEIAYFAQNSAAYETLGRPVTPILHRQSFTIIEGRQLRALSKLHINFRDLFDGKQAVTLKVSEELHAADEAKVFAEVEEAVNTQLNRLDQLLSNSDPTLGANLATRRRKIIYHIGELRRKALFAAVRRDGTAQRRIHGVFSNLFPEGALQERSINSLVFLNKFGTAFIDWLYDAADPGDKGHRVIEL